jgi:hypothetical protein
MHGCRRYMLLLLMMLFTGSYLVQATSTIAVGVKLYPTAAVAVLAAECASYHVARAATGEFWVLGDDARKGVGMRLVDFLVSTVVWLTVHACPLWTFRDPNWIGPHVVAWTIMCSLLDGAAVICVAHLFSASPGAADNSFSNSTISNELAIDDTASARRMARSISLPALFIALVSLALFLSVVEPRHRRTFVARDTRRAMHRRHWAEAEARSTADEDRSKLVVSEVVGCVRYIGDLACVWIVSGAQEWAGKQPSWYTEEWRAAVRVNAHLMGEGAAEALGAMAKSDDVACSGVCVVGAVALQTV